MSWKRKQINISLEKKAYRVSFDTGTPYYDISAYSIDEAIEEAKQLLELEEGTCSIEVYSKIQVSMNIDKTDKSFLWL